MQAMPIPTRANLDAKTFTVSFERTFSASPDEVFDAWTTPEQVTQWWDPTNLPLVECLIDLREGGVFRFVNDGHGPPFEGVYRAVERPAKLVFDAVGAVGTVTIQRRGATTHLLVTIRCASAEHFEQLVKVGVATGTERTLDNLVSFLE